MADIQDLMWESLRTEITRLSERVESIAIRYERAEVADSAPAYAYADLPTAAGGGLGDNVSYCTFVFVSNGRKSGEGVGAGTGIWAYWDNAAGVWKGIRSEIAVTV